MATKRWVVVQVRYPRDVWETGKDEFRANVCERGGRFRPDNNHGSDVDVTVYTEHEAATASEAAMQAIEAIESDGLAAGIGRPTAINVGSPEEPPMQHYTYARRAS